MPDKREKRYVVLSIQHANTLFSETANNLRAACAEMLELWGGPILVVRKSGTYTIHKLENAQDLICVDESKLYASAAHVSSP